MADEQLPVRWLPVPERARGMRLDRFLARRFADRSRSQFAAWIKQGLVMDEQGQPLRASATMRGGEQLQIAIPGIAPDSPKPPFPVVLHEDERIVVVDKPAGMLVHPTGTAFAWAIIGLARERWPDADIVHRLDRDTSGVLVLSKDPEANVFLKAAFKTREVVKHYEALVRGTLVAGTYNVREPIGEAEGPIRIQMAVRPDGLPAHTDIEVLAHREVGGHRLTHVRCRLHTGRTHQIRVHCAHIGEGIVGDRMYGVPPEVFLHAWENGVDESTVRAAGAPRQALHAASIRMPHPSGGEVEVHAPFPPDMARWWADPTCLPLDEGHSDVPRGTAALLGVGDEEPGDDTDDESARVG
ncbi:MAG: RluA family pseudouridine synthase [Deltaproteobacteria bacterium]|nr:MAG: RluA family pseudouridine synthase [Deltaproteobacteria bacterium]